MESVSLDSIHASNESYAGNMLLALVHHNHTENMINSDSDYTTYSAFAV